MVPQCVKKVHSYTVCHMVPQTCVKNCTYTTCCMVPQNGEEDLHLSGLPHGAADQ